MTESKNENDHFDLDHFDHKIRRVTFLIIPYQNGYAREDSLSILATAYSD